MGLLEKVARFIEEKELLSPGERVVVGISGGIDSVVLTAVLHGLGYRVIGAHVNYRLRGSQSEEDEAFVRAYMRRLGLPLHVHYPPTRAYAREHRKSLQEAARDLRYAYFLAVAREEAAWKVAVAHHMDDQAETILMNLFRGTGLEGLAGMPEKRPLAPDAEVELIRPFLEVRREELEAYARAHHLPWRDDPSNRNPAYRRSALRVEIVPQIVRHFGPGVIPNIAALGRKMREYLASGLVLDVEAWLDRHLQYLPDGNLALPLDALETLPEIWQGRIILEVLRRLDGPRTEAAVREVLSLRSRQPGRHLRLGSLEVWRERDALVFVRHRPEPMPEPKMLEPGKPLVLPTGTLTLEQVEGPPFPAAEGVEYLDAEKVRGPLRVRPWAPGDRFRPLGMKQSKKISDFLTDARVPSYLRAAIPVVEDAEKIVAVPGLRIAEEVRITPETRSAWKLTYKPHHVASDATR